MNKREIGVLVCRTIALLAVLGSFEYVGQVLSALPILLSPGGTFLLAYATPLVVIVLRLNFAFFLWILANRISLWMFSDRQEKPFVSSLSFYDWHALALSILGLYMISTCINHIQILMSFPTNMRLNWSANKIIVIGIALQLLLGCFFVFRSRDITRFIFKNQTKLALPDPTADRNPEEQHP